MDTACTVCCGISRRSGLVWEAVKAPLCHAWHMVAAHGSTPVSQGSVPPDLVIHPSGTEIPQAQFPARVERYATVKLVSMGDIQHHGDPDKCVTCSTVGASQTCRFQRQCPLSRGCGTCWVLRIVKSKAMYGWPGGCTPKSRGHVTCRVTQKCRSHVMSLHAMRPARGGRV